MTDREEQLDLLGGWGGEKKTRDGMRWLVIDGPGKVGRIALPEDSEIAALAREHKPDVMLAIAVHEASRAHAAKEANVDLRGLDPEAPAASWHGQVEALYADVRAGRRAIIAADDSHDGALLAACLLVALGKSKDEAIDVIGRDAIGDSRLARLGFFALTREKEEPQEEEREENKEDEVPFALDDLRGEDDDEDDAEEEEDEIEQHIEAPRTVRIVPSDLAALARSPRYSRIAGAVLGGAIGDAMGHPTEFISSFDAIRNKYGPNGVEGFELWWDRDGKRFAPYTDDTQMAEQVLRALLWGRDRSADLDATMRKMAELFVDWSNKPQGGHRAPGNACLSGCRALSKGTPWYEAGGDRAGGCGSVMRAYPFGLFFANDLAKAEEWSVAHSKLTHRDPIALAASAAMAVGIARIVRDEPVDHVLSEMVAAACRYSPSTAAMIARAIDEAQQGVDPETTLKRLQGWAAHEAIAAAAYVFARHPDDPRAAILEGANTPGDSDSIATLAGALVGARMGVGAIPTEWVRDVERSDELIALATML